MQGYHRAWTYLSLASPLVEHDYTYTKLWSSWENTVFIMMQTRSVSSVGPAKPTHFSAIFLSNSKISSTRETASSKLYRVVPGTTGTRHCVAKLVPKSDVSASSMNGSAQLNYQVMKQNVLDEVQKLPKSMHQIQVVNSFQYSFPEYKTFQLVHTKRVLDPLTFIKHPYGYKDVDERNIYNLLLLVWYYTIQYALPIIHKITNV